MCERITDPINSLIFLLSILELSLGGYRVPENGIAARTTDRIPSQSDLLRTSFCHQVAWNRGWHQWIITPTAEE